MPIANNAMNKMIIGFPVSLFIWTCFGLLVCVDLISLSMMFESPDSRALLVRF